MFSLDYIVYFFHYHWTFLNFFSLFSMILIVMTCFQFSLEFIQCLLFYQISLSCNLLFAFPWIMLFVRPLLIWRRMIKQFSIVKKTLTRNQNGNDIIHNSNPILRKSYHILHTLFLFYDLTLLFLSQQSSNISFICYVLCSVYKKKFIVFWGNENTEWEWEWRNKQTHITTLISKWKRRF